MDGARELPDAIYVELKRYCAAGDELANQQDFEGAIRQYNEAWTLIPNPKTEWNASTWVLAGIADAAFSGGYLTSALEALRYAMHCPGGLGNPFLHLRLGQVLLDRGEPEEATNELGRAYMGAGPEIFAEQDAKYLAFLSTRMKL